MNGPNTSPVWSFLKAQKSGDVTCAHAAASASCAFPAPTDAQRARACSWNFAACFVIDKEGNVVERSSKLPASCEAKIKSLL